jgi:hypothetical protein
MALGEYGKDMVALAAADYFFDTKYKRAVRRSRSGNVRRR